MSRRTVNVDAGKNVDVELCTDAQTGDKTYTVSAKTDPSVTRHLTQLDTAISKKADTAYVDAGLAKKADTDYVNRALSKKADLSYVNTALSRKADISYVNTELSKKADTAYVNTELSKKAGLSYVNTELSRKADTDYVNTELSRKADTDYVNTALSRKADTDYVNAELSRKADTDYVNTELSRKADTDYVNTELAGKVDRSEMVEELSLKVDKEEGKGLSSNDYTDADREKLTSIVWLPAEDGGDAVSLVTTGEKFQWDSKQERIDYYLEGARVDNDTLVITGSDGTEITFTGTGTGAIDRIATPDGDLDIVNKRVTIPLATAITGSPGDAGLVRGICEEFNENGQVTRP
jgi:GMP synthase PP-ATPase subunit